MALAGMVYWSLATQNVVYVALNTAPLLRYRLALFLKDILPFALLPPPPARARGWRGAIRGFFYPFIFAWHCSQFDME